MSRWAVRKRPRTDEWYALLDKGLNVRCVQFSSWHAAMRFVGKQVRTIEVTLPPVMKHPSDDVPGPTWHVSEGLVRPWVSTVDQSVWHTDQRGLGDQINANTAERLGLALLAAAKHAKGELP